MRKHDVVLMPTLPMLFPFFVDFKKALLWWIGAHILGGYLSLAIGFIFLSFEYNTHEFRAYLKRVFLRVVLSNDADLFWKIYSQFYDGQWLIWLFLILLGLWIAMLTGMVLESARES